MKNEIKNYGLDIEATLEGLDSNHYLLGSTSKLGTEIIQADGNWLPYIPAYEPQFTANYETYGCTVFGTYNAIETLMKKIYGNDYDFAERFTYILAGIRPPGGDPHKVIELIRTKGMLPQARMPLTDTYEQFIQPDPLTPDLIDEALKFLNDKEIGHEWIFTNNPKTADRISMLQWALQRGTVAVSVTAWYQDENGLYIDGGRPNTHWCELVDIEEKDGKFYPIIIDSYDLIINGISTAFKKRLHPDHRILMAKRYAVVPKTPMTEAQKKSIWDFIQKAIDAIKLALGLIQKQVDELPKPPAPVPPPVVVHTPFPEPKPVPKYLWDTKTNIRHSIRVIADEEGLTLLQKDLACDIASCESQFVIDVRGRVDPRDRGLFQWNSKYHPEITDAIAFDPEKNARLGCQAVKQGKAHSYWSASEFCWNANHKYDAIL